MALFSAIAVVPPAPLVPPVRVPADESLPKNVGKKCWTSGLIAGADAAIIPRFVSTFVQIIRLKAVHVGSRLNAL